MKSGKFPIFNERKVVEYSPSCKLQCCDGNKLRFFATLRQTKSAKSGARGRPTPTPHFAYFGGISVKIFVCERSRNTRASGVFPVGDNDSFNAPSFPAPDATTETSSAAAIAA